VAESARADLTFSQVHYSLGLANGLRALGQLAEAEQVYGQAMANCDLIARRWAKLVARFSYLGEQAQAQASRGLLRAAAGRLAEAEADLRGALDLVAQLPPRDQQTAIRFYLRDRARVRAALGNVLWAAGRRPEAAEAFRQAEEEWRGGTRASAAQRNQRAWFLATCPDPQFRDPAAAVDLAQQAVKEVPEGAPWWATGVQERRPGDMRRTLGVALYRAGDWNAAVKALQKGAELREGGDSSDWFFLAMAHWQLGDKDQARRWFDQAAAWMGKNQPKNEELLRFRREAEALLQIQGKEKPE
jgi:tetratricopeptide (TPR) repeat protein